MAIQQLINFFQQQLRFQDEFPKIVGSIIVNLRNTLVRNLSLKTSPLHTQSAHILNQLERRYSIELNDIENEGKDPVVRAQYDFFDESSTQGNRKKLIFAPKRAKQAGFVA